MTQKSPLRLLRVGVLTSHPIQYQAPWFRALAKFWDLEVFFAFKPTPKEQGAGFGVDLTWDVDLLSGYHYRFLTNISPAPNVEEWAGCDTPEIGDIIEAGKFDAFIVPGWYLKSHWQAIRACRKLGIPVTTRGDSQLATPRSWFKKVIKKLWFHYRLCSFDAFMTVGVRHREYLEHYGVDPRHIFFAPHFIDTDWFAVRAAASWSQRAALRASWGASGDTCVSLFVGKFQEKKRPADLLRAAVDVPGDHLVVFVGSGELDVHLRSLAIGLGVNCFFAGFKNQSQLPAVYAAADVLVLPSDGGETWGLVVNEAMACGIPVIISDACGCAPDMIEPGHTGYTFPVGDTFCLAERIESVMRAKSAGHDWRPALKRKIQVYSLENAAFGTIATIESLLI
jgi:glycosyltransferase involved in cell wall biosynthesis